MIPHTVGSGVRTLIGNHGLLRALTRREVEVRYRGTILGVAWAVLYPLALLAVYTFLFGLVFKARWPGTSDLPDFVLMLYCGLITYGIVTETLTRAPLAISSQPNYVKKVVFPLELLPLSHLGAALVNAAIGFVLLVVFVVAQKHTLPATSVAVPIVLAPLVVMVAGVAWLLACLGVFFRDIGQIINLAMTMLMAFSPVFYPVSAAPEFIRRVMYLNPLTYPIEEVRRVLVVGQWPEWHAWLLYSAAAVMVAVSGLWAFQNTRRAFADVV